MKRLSVILLTVLLSIQAWSQADSARYARLDSALVNYTSALEIMDLSVKAQECDFLIGSATDSLVTQHIALWLWDFYKDSKLMGDEAVAIYIYDNWLNNGKIAMRGEFDKLDADIFASFNRSTLIGMDAPRISLLNKRGRHVELPADNCVSILYFYDTGCGKCKLESRLLPSVLADVDFPARFYAVYAGTNAREWKSFRRSFKLKNRHVDLVHLWDPEMESDYLRLYGVTSTPKLYVIDDDGKVLGRRLEVDSLKEIINYICISYGQKED